MVKANLESRFERYADVMVEALGHAPREPSPTAYQWPPACVPG